MMGVVVRTKKRAPAADIAALQNLGVSTTHEAMGRRAVQMLLGQEERAPVRVPMPAVVRESHRTGTASDRVQRAARGRG